MVFGSLGGEDDGEHTGIGYVGVSQIFPMQDEFVLVTISFDELQHQPNQPFLTLYFPGPFLLLLLAFRSFFS